MNNEFLNELLIDYIIKEEKSDLRVLCDSTHLNESRKKYSLSHIKKIKKRKENFDVKVVSLNFSCNNLHSNAQVKAAMNFNEGEKEPFSSSEEEVEIIKEVSFYFC